jgi:cytochrome c oxidase cbb3-type subunit 3
MHTKSRTFCKRSLQLAVAISVAAVLGCVDPPGKPNPADKPLLPDQVLGFADLFANNCAGCHGANGELGPAPPLNDPLFVEIISKDQLASVIRDGRVGTPMPPFSQAQGGMLTDAQINALVEGIRSNWSAPTPSESLAPSYTLVKESHQGNAERGAEMFARACAECHGADGRGTLHEGVATNVINSPVFLALISDQALRRIIITGRHDLGMPSYAERDGRPHDFLPLTSADVDDLVALLSSWRTTGTTAATSMQ